MKVLLVEDEEQFAGLVQRELQREYNYDVVVAANLFKAEKCLTSQPTDNPFDVTVVDILYDPLVTEFDRRNLTSQVRPTDRPLLASGLSVITAAAEVKPPPGVVVWTSGDPSRRLHLVFAKEDLGVRVFCSKRSGNGSLRPLHQAIQAAASHGHYVDNILGVYLPGNGSIPLGQTLLREQDRRTIWRALALGYHTADEIADVTPYKSKAVRTKWGEMFNDLRSVDPGIEQTKKPQPELVRYATSNRCFFLDEAVRKVYP